MVMDFKSLGHHLEIFLAASSWELFSQFLKSLGVCLGTIGSICIVKLAMELGTHNVL